MKVLFSAVLIVAMAMSLAVAQDATPIQSVKWATDGVETFFGPQDAFRVTITSANGVVSVVDVPKGVILNVVASENAAGQLKDSSKYPHLFRGDMTIRCRRSDEVRDGESRVASEMMAKAPLDIKLREVVVSVAKVD